MEISTLRIPLECFCWELFCIKEQICHGRKCNFHLPNTHILWHPSKSHRICCQCWKAVLLSQCQMTGSWEWGTVVKSQSGSEVHQARLCWWRQGNATYSVGKASFLILQFLPPLFQAEKLKLARMKRRVSSLSNRRSVLWKQKKELGLFGLVKQDWTWEKMTL